ncbi:MAG: dipeptidase [Syntrophomonadales bacterium]|jgi:membrane dipeptidase
MIVDCHADTLSRIASLGEHLQDNSGHFDLNRARKAGIELQVLSLYSSERDSKMALEDILMQIDYFEQEMMSCKEMAYPVRSVQDLERNTGGGRTGMMLHLEGAEALGTKLSNLRTLYRLGVRSIGLTWNHRNLLADGVMDAASGGGLSEWGREVVNEMNRLGMVVDLAHISPAGFRDAVEMASKPMIVSHANTYSLCKHPRNLKDEQLRTITSIGGIVGVTFVPAFVDRMEATIEKLADHVGHMIQIMGEDHVALGSDFDGTETTVVPDVSAYPLLVEELEKRSLTARQIDKVLRGNFLRVLKDIL